MPIRNPGRYPIHIAVTPSTHPDRFHGKYAGRESRFLYGISGIAEFPERLPGHRFMDCVYQDLHNAQGEYIFLTVDHLDPQNSAVLPRLQQLRSRPTEPPDNITDPVSRLRQPRDLDPATAAELLRLYARFYGAFQPEAEPDPDQLKKAAALEVPRQS